VEARKLSIRSSANPPGRVKIEPQGSKMVKALIWLQWRLLQFMAKLPVIRGLPVPMFYPNVILHHLGAVPSWVYKEIFLNNCYDVLPSTTPTRSIIDLGANIGLASLYFRLKYPEAKIISVEPNPDALRCLRLNLIRRSSVQIVPVAIAGKAGQIPLWLDTHETTKLNSSLVGRDMAGREHEFTNITVEALTIDSLVESKVDLLKMDIEGAEYQVLRSLIVQPSYIHSVVVEFHDLPTKTAEFEAVRAILEGRGYGCIDRLPQYAVSGSAIMRFVPSTVSN
jgi:FkbM family methyltransferase